MLHKYYHWLLRHVEYSFLLIIFSLLFTVLLFMTQQSCCFWHSCQFIFYPAGQLFYCFWPNHPVIFDLTGLHEWKAAQWWAFLPCFDTVVVLFLTQPSSYFWPNRTTQVESCSLVSLSVLPFWHSCPTVFDPTIQLFLTQQDCTSGKLLTGEPICPTVLTQLSYCFWPNYPVIFDPTGLHEWKAAHWWAEEGADHCAAEVGRWASATTGPGDWWGGETLHDTQKAQVRLLVCQWHLTALIKKVWNLWQCKVMLDVQKLYHLV